MSLGPTWALASTGSQTYTFTLRGIPGGVLAVSIGKERQARGTVVQGANRGELDKKIVVDLIPPEKPGVNHPNDDKKDNYDKGGNSPAITQQNLIAD